MKRLTLFYVSTYPLVGGLGLAFCPETALRFFLSNGNYGDIIPRVAGMLMIGLSGLIALMAYHRDYRYYPYSISIRGFFVLFFFFLYFRSDDPLFLVLNVIILVGLVPSIYTLAFDRRSGGWR
jgi:hypothetical protein